MLPVYIFIALLIALCVNAYSNNLFNLINSEVNVSGVGCGGFSNPKPIIKLKTKLFGNMSTTTDPEEEETFIEDFSFSTVANHGVHDENPFEEFQTTLNKILFGDQIDGNDVDGRPTFGAAVDPDLDILAHYPSGYVMRAELFQDKSGVHLPSSQWMHRGHCYLNTTKDFMQTAVNAFAIFLEGNLDDVLRLPAMYVLRSARTIAMMKIAREKLVATWDVVKGEHEAETITYQTLEYYRPLFKYINGREMSRLNLDDERILSYIGTHAELDRHQVGVIASKYIEVNKYWTDPKYLNLMNNLLCGVPMKFMRRIPESTYLQLSHQLFYHIKACDPLQRRFYLAMMTRTQVLGKSNSWSARDVARLGLLLTEVDGPELSAINPEAMVGITSQVMLEMSARNLKFFTKTQLRYLAQKPLNILTKKINTYEDELQILNSVVRTRTTVFNLITYFVIAMKIIT